MTLPMSVYDFSTVRFLPPYIKGKLNFLTKLQFSESTLCKPFAKNIADELATAVREHLCNM